jgi:hypothetical protein
MDFPIYHLDGLGNPLLIGLISVLHAVINHAMAVGAIPLIVLMEWRGMRLDQKPWDDLARKVLRVCFVVTTSVGALTGVGIWLAAALVNPAAIGSLLRVFFWAWFFEWLIFVVEVCLIMAYELTWPRLAGAAKPYHLLIGLILSLASWLTMAVICAILGFMMAPGGWVEEPTLWRGLTNPIYLPQLAFRTAFAMVTAGLFALFLIPFFREIEEGFRRQACRLIALWTLLWLPLCLAGGWWYWTVVPSGMAANIPSALTSQFWPTWEAKVIWLMAASGVAVLAIAFWALLHPRSLPRPVLFLPFLLAVFLFGYFERVREFIRKPFIIGQYMYSNGLRVEDYPLYQREGLLRYAAYVPFREVKKGREREAGEAVFRLACSRCHTTNGVLGVAPRLRWLFKEPPWSPQALAGFIRTMHHARPFMPPFPGHEAELNALGIYLAEGGLSPPPLRGAQDVGVALPTEAEPSVSPPKPPPLPLPSSSTRPHVPLEEKAMASEGGGG